MSPRRQATDRVESPPPHEFDLSTGELCLSFANTLGDRPCCREEHLESYADLLEWSRQTELFEPSRLDRLARSAAGAPSRADAALAQAVALREAIYGLFAARLEGRPAAPRDLATLNEVLAGGMSRADLIEEDGAYRWCWCHPDRDLASPLWPIARSTADLLTSADADRIGRCSSESCSWLFIDRSPSRRRRWCDMKVCGNRAKARRHYRRRKREPRSDSE